ncbi:hypothetical protein ACHAQI_006490 [Fusarium lateritium]
MRFSGSLIFGLLAVNGLAQTVVPDQQPSDVAQPEPSAPAAEEPSVPAQNQPSAPAEDDDDDDTPQTDAEDSPIATAAPEPTANDPVETAGASQISGDDQPTATASDDDDDNDDEATTAAEETATADASATGDDDTTATATETDDDDDETDTATATATSSSAPTSSAAVVEVNLNNATIGDNAELVTVEGKPAIKLSAPANGQATFSVPVETDDDDFASDDLIYIVASIRVGEASGSAKLRRRDAQTDCSLQIQAGGQTVYNEPLSTNNGEFQDVTSSGISSSDMGKSTVEVTQKCGDKPAPLTVRNVRAGTESGVKSSGGSGSGGSGSGGSSGESGNGKGGNGGSGSGSGGSATTGAGARETGDSGNFGSKSQASLGAFAAAILAAAALF